MEEKLCDSLRVPIGENRCEICKYRKFRGKIKIFEERKRDFDIKIE